MPPFFSDNPLRIAFYSSGLNIFPQLRAKPFVEMGWDVYFFGEFPPEENGKLFVPGLKYVQLKRRWPSRFLRWFDSPIQVNRWTKNLHIDILHIMGTILCLAAPFSRAKRVVIENNGSDVLVAPHSCFKTRALYRLCYPFADGILQDSVPSQQAGIRWGASPSNNEVIELGIDFSIYRPDLPKGIMRNKLGIPKDEKIVLSPRSFSENYNIDTIIRSIPRVKEVFPGVHFLFCGYQTQQCSHLATLAKKLNVWENIRFLGVVDKNKELPLLYADSDLVVSVPSSDSLPGSVHEALACGTPVVISDLPWYAFKFKADKEVFVVPVKDPLALGEKTIGILRGAFSWNPVEISELVRKDSDSRICTRKLESFYRKLLSLTSNT